MSFTDGFADGSFTGYLAQDLNLLEEERPSGNEWLRFGNTIGALALRVGLLTSAQVDKVLERQEVRGGYFGDIAVESGDLTSHQVAQLLELQQLHDDLFLAEQLVVAGRIDVPTLLNKLCAYHAEAGASAD